MGSNRNSKIYPCCDCNSERHIVRCQLARVSGFQKRRPSPVRTKMYISNRRLICLQLRNWVSWSNGLTNGYSCGLHATHSRTPSTGLWGAEGTSEGVSVRSSSKCALANNSESVCLWPTWLYRQSWCYLDSNPRGLISNLAGSLHMYICDSTRKTKVILSPETHTAIGARPLHLFIGSRLSFSKSA